MSQKQHAAIRHADVYCGHASSVRLCAGCSHVVLLTERALVLGRQCYKEVCLGNACTKFPCISSNIYVRYNETNDRITSLEAGYENALFYDGEKLFGVNATDTLAPGQVRESHFHFRFGTQV